MISRVAENCFWMHRYVERAENTARLLHVNRNFVMDVNVPVEHRWHPVVVVSGEHDRFPELFSEEAAHDGEIVQEYLTWNEDNPVSIASSVRWARENARTIREVISLEMWQVLNGTFHWLMGGEGRHLYQSDRDAFYERIKEAAAHFDGVFHNTILHEEPYHFMLLGIFLERAGQTSRILDVKHHMVESSGNGRETALEAAAGLALLRSCSATESYFKRNRAAPSGRTIAPFVILDARFPRSVLHCLSRARTCLAEIRSFTGRQEMTRSAVMLDELVSNLREHDADSLLAAGIHAELTWVIDRTTEVCNAIHEDYFDPSFSSASQTGRVES